MRVIYAFELLPAKGTKAIFLAGPTPRAPIGAPATPSWRQDAIAFLEKINFDGDVLIPEPRDGWRPDYEGQVDWECEGRRRSDLIAFWVPRDLETMPAFTTNIEFGEDMTTDQIVYGRPDGSPKNKYLDNRYIKMGHTPHTTLESLLTAIVELLGEGAERTDGERNVPLWIWQTDSFQSWYDGVKTAGNTLVDFQVQKLFRFAPGPGNIFAWSAKVNIFIKDENRYKANETVFARGDVSMVVPFLTDTPDMDFVLTREFRAPVNNPNGAQVEPPAGSSPSTKSPRMVALEELEEEIGLTVEADRLIYVDTRQVASTMLSHKLHLFALRLTKEESGLMREHARSHRIFGANPDAENGERITLAIGSNSAIDALPLDWTTYGAICAARQVLHA